DETIRMLTNEHRRCTSRQGGMQSKSGMQTRPLDHGPTADLAQKSLLVEQTPGGWLIVWQRVFDLRRRCPRRLVGRTLSWRRDSRAESISARDRCRSPFCTSAACRSNTGRKCLVSRRLVAASSIKLASLLMAARTPLRRSARARSRSESELDSFHELRRSRYW